MISDISTEIKIIDDCDDLPSGIKSIRKHKPDVVFLDIEMPGHSGLEILDFFDEKEINFDIVFTTGYSEYALQAFQLSAIDYLLKPINLAQLKRVIEKIEKKGQSNELEQYKTLQHNLNSGQDILDKCITVNLTNSTRFLKLKNIILLKAEGAYTEIYLADGEKLTTSKNLKYYEDLMIDFQMMYRSHKSNIVNLSKAKQLNKSEASILLENNIIAQISSEKFDQFLQKMSALN